MANETNVPPVRPLTRGWVKLLDDVRLPVPQASHDRVCKAIRDNRSSLRDIAELMQAARPWCLSVMREANHTHGSLAEPAENLEVALNRLGLKRAEELLARLPSVPMSEIPVALRQLQLISPHASRPMACSPAAWRDCGRTFTGAACCFCRRCGHWRWPTPSCWTNGNCG
jgi:hypothetical protein